MKPWEAVIHVFKNSFNFSGRARRSEYCWFMLFITALFILLMYLTDQADTRKMRDFYDALFLIYLAVFALPFLSVFVRRLHDVGLPGWRASRAAKFFFFFILFFEDSQPGKNKYGPNPKANEKPNTYYGSRL